MSVMAEATLGFALIGWRHLPGDKRTSVSTTTYRGICDEWEDVTVAFTVYHKKTDWTPGEKTWMIRARIYKVEYTNRSIIVHVETGDGIVDPSKIQVAD